jgi:hypothetical protein
LKERNNVSLKKMQCNLCKDKSVIVNVLHCCVLVDSFHSDVRMDITKPSAYESEIHPLHKPTVYATGISPLQGGRCHTECDTLWQAITKISSSHIFD